MRGNSVDVQSSGSCPSLEMQFNLKLLSSHRSISIVALLAIAKLKKTIQSIDQKLLEKKYTRFAESVYSFNNAQLMCIHIVYSVYRVKQVRARRRECNDRNETMCSNIGYGKLCQPFQKRPAFVI